MNTKLESIIDRRQKIIKQNFQMVYHLHGLTWNMVGVLSVAK